jgi:hypothetical protein
MTLNECTVQDPDEGEGEGERKRERERERMMKATRLCRSSLTQKT